MEWATQKTVKSVLLAHETPPAMITEIQPTAEIAFRAGFTHIQFIYFRNNKIQLFFNNYFVIYTFT